MIKNAHKCTCTISNNECLHAPAHIHTINSSFKVHTHTKHKYMHAQRLKQAGFFQFYRVAQHASPEASDKVFGFLYNKNLKMFLNFARAWPEKLNPTCRLPDSGVFGWGYGRSMDRGTLRGKERGIGGFEINSVSLLSLPYQHDCLAAL